MGKVFFRPDLRFLSAWLPIVVALVLACPSGARAQTPEEQFDSAMAKYEAAALPDAIGLFDKAITQLESSRGDGRSRELLLKAYQFRSRAHLGVGDPAAAKLDLLTLLQLQPGFELPEGVSESLRTLYSEVRSTIIGDRLIVITPEDAQVEIDGQPVKDLSQPLPLKAGRHVLSARRPGYTSVVDKPFDVEPGTRMELSLPLARNSATVTVITDPVGVEVFVDGVSRGLTESSELSGTASAGKLISDLDIRTHRFEFSRPCFTTLTQTVDIDKFDDRALPTIKLARAIATVSADTPTPGVVMFIDGVPRGPAPLTIPDVCEGKHTVELRSPHGRYVRRVDLKPGDREAIAGELSPAFAFISSSGGVEGLRGANDLRADVEARLREVRGFTLYAPPLDAAQAALKRRDLPADWLAFDRQGEAIAGAQKLSPGLRVQMSSDLARAFEAQGVASVTLAPGSTAQSEVVLSLLASGSSVPDTIPVRLDDGDSLRRTIQTLDVGFAAFRPSLGLLAVDVSGPAGVNVIAADVSAKVQAAGLMPGDRIVAVNGKKIDGVAALNGVLQTLGAKDPLSLDVLHNTTPKKVDLPLLHQPRAINLGDQSLLFNPLLVHLRHQLAFGANTPAEPVLRLNIGIALMRLGNWEEARAELERTALPDGPGVAQGTVQYHLGACYEKLGRFMDATQAWKKAAASQALLTEDGPPIKELAEARLASASGAK
jgi:tetratricopeptide (TPR) repeat protein